MELKRNDDIACLSCGEKFDKKQKVHKDELGNHMVCKKCHATSNVPA